VITYLVTVDGLWDCLREEARVLEATAEQLRAIGILERLMAAKEHSPYARATLEVRSTSVGLAISVHQATEAGKPIVNGSWFRLTIEPNGFVLLSSSLNEGQVTLDPADYT